MDRIRNSPDFIVASVVLYQKDKFVLKDILMEVHKKLLGKYFNSSEELELFVKNKISSLCELGLISDTGLFYYIH